MAFVSDSKYDLKDKAYPNRGDWKPFFIVILKILGKYLEKNHMNQDFSSKNWLLKYADKNMK